MATTPGATMRFDIVADPAQFNQAVASAQQNWAKATGEMQAAAAPVGEALTAAVGSASLVLSGVADSLATAFTGGASAAERETLKAFDAIKAQAGSLLDALGSLGEKWGGQFGKRVGDAVAGAAKGSIGGVATGAVEKLDTLVPAEKITERVAALKEIEAWAAQADNAVAGAAGSIATNMRNMLEGIASARDAILGRAMKIDDFAAIIGAIDKQIEKHDTNIKLIGKTAAEVAKLRAEWQAMEVTGAGNMSEKQKGAFQDKIGELGAAAEQEQNAKDAVAQAKAFEQITIQMQRQTELAGAKTREDGKSAGALAEERMIRDAMTRMQQRGRDLSAEELDIIQDQAAVMRQVTDTAAAANFTRQSNINAARSVRSSEMEQGLIGATAGQAAEAKAFAADLQRARDQNIELTAEMKQGMADNARSIGEAAQAAAEMKDRLTQVREAGQVVARSLESAFDKFVSGAKLNFRDLVASMLQDMAKLAFKQSVIQPLFGGTAANSSGILGNIFSGIAGMRADGGPVTSGSTYLVGERGPELFTPGSSGSIMPNGSFGGGGEIVVTIVASPELHASIQSTAENVVARQAPGIVGASLDATRRALPSMMNNAQRRSL